MWMWMVLGCAGGADDTGTELEPGMEGAVAIAPKEWWQVKGFHRYSSEEAAEGVYLRFGPHDVAGDSRNWVEMAEIEEGVGPAVAMVWDLSTGSLWLGGSETLAPQMVIGEPVGLDGDVTLLGVEACSGEGGICLRVGTTDGLSGEMLFQHELPPMQIQDAGLRYVWTYEGPDDQAN